MTASIADFVRAAEDSGILLADSLAEYLRGVDQIADAASFARRLVEEGRLTAFQAEHIYGGKGQSLVLGPYVVLDVLGQGGMGCVYKAQHRKMRRVVALKVIATKSLGNLAAVHRFEREVQAAARLEHPNIVTAHDAGEASGTHYLVMQFVDGKTLSDIVKESGPQPASRAVDWMLQAARGLAFAHEQGVIHRDIKPGNLLVDSRGTVKILDMGLARLESLDADQDQLTGTGEIMGTVDYMAPEQAMDTRQADARSDIYSLGVTLWYLLTGRPLFEADSVLKKILAHQHEPARSLLDARVSTEPRLDAVFQRMVAKNPDDRFQSMQEVIAALQSLPHGPAAPAPPRSDLGAGVASLGRLDADATQTFQRQKPAATHESTATFNAVHGDTLPVPTPLPRPGDPRPQRLLAGLTPLQLAMAGGGLITVVFVGLLAWGARGRHGLPPSTETGPFDVERPGPRRPPQEPVTAAPLPSPPATSLTAGSVSNPAERRTGGDAIDFDDLTPADDDEWGRHWVAHGPGNWQARGGVLGHPGQGRGWIATKRRYADFEVEVEYRLPVKGNTGIFLRAWPEGNLTGADFVEVQLADDEALKTTSLNCTGAIFKRVIPTPRPETKPDEWNTAVVRVVGGHVTVVVNGTKCIDANVDFPRNDGAIGLQLLESSVEFRRVRVRNLSGG